MLQGHHRSSARLYSRNDTFGSLHLQRTITEAVCNGFRPQRSMSRGAQAPSPESPFQMDSLWPPELLPNTSMHAGPWEHFTSRHELLQLQPPALHAEPASDSEAESEAVQAWAEAYASSGCTADFSHDESEQPQLRVCNGPWSSLHRPTESSIHAFLDSDSTDVHLVKPACGCKLGIAAMFVWTCNLHNACTRKGCA